MEEFLRHYVKHGIAISEIKRNFAELHILKSLPSNFAPAVFEFNNSSYIVWIDKYSETGNINIAPIKINTNGEISIDPSKKILLMVLNFVNAIRVS